MNNGWMLKQAEKQDTFKITNLTNYYRGGEYNNVINRAYALEEEGLTELPPQVVSMLENIKDEKEDYNMLFNEGCEMQELINSKFQTLILSHYKRKLAIISIFVSIVIAIVMKPDIFNILPLVAIVATVILSRKRHRSQKDYEACVSECVNTIEDIRIL